MTTSTHPRMSTRWPPPHRQTTQRPTRSSRRGSQERTRRIWPFSAQTIPGTSQRRTWWQTSMSLWTLTTSSTKRTTFRSSMTRAWTRTESSLPFRPTGPHRCSTTTNRYLQTQGSTPPPLRHGRTWRRQQRRSQQTAWLDGSPCGATGTLWTQLSATELLSSARTGRHV